MSHVPHDRPHTEHGHGSPDDFYSAADRVWSGNPNGALVAEISGMPPGRALDVGCGEGADAVWLAERGWRVTAIDPSAVALEHGRKAAQDKGVDVDWVHGSLPGTAVGEAAYELVSVCFPALDKGLGIERALAAAVAPGGTLLVVTHESIDAERARAHGIDPDQRVDADAMLAALDDGWQVEAHERRDREPTEGAGAHHHSDIVLRARRA